MTGKRGAPAFEVGGKLLTIVETAGHETGDLAGGNLEHEGAQARGTRPAMVKPAQAERGMGGQPDTATVRAARGKTLGHGTQETATRGEFTVEIDPADNPAHVRLPRSGRGIGSPLRGILYVA